MTSAPPPDASTPPAPRASLSWRGAGIALVALAIGAATGTFGFVLLAVVTIVVVRWARVAGRSTVGRILAATEFQMAPALDALGFTVATEGRGPRAPDAVVSEVVPESTRTVQRRFVPVADLRPLEIATVEVAGGLTGLRQRAVVTVAHELGDPADEPAAATLLQATTLVPTGEVPETTRFACAHGWVIAAFDPLRTRDPGNVAGELAAALTRIVGDARAR